MIKISFRFTRTLALGTLTLSGAVFFASCQATRLGPFSKSDIENNLYFSFFKAQKDKKVLGKISSSSYNLMRATFPEYLSDISKQIQGQSLLEEMPQGLIHGDFHPLQMAWREGEAQLDDWDTVSHGPLWIDIVRMESAAKLLAKEQGLRAYPESPCLNSYKEGFLTKKKPASSKAIRPGAKDEELHQDFSKHPVWKNAERNSAVPSNLEAALNTWIQQNPELPIKTFHPKRRLVSGVGSLNKEKVLILDTQNQLWELKEVDSQPLSVLGTSKNPLEGCARYEELQKNLAGLSKKSPVVSCWNWEGRTFTLLRWDARYWSPSDKDFKDTDQLVSHVQWMCSEMAQFHRQSLSEIDQRHWILALQSNKNLKLRLQNLSERVFKNIEDGFRMILLENHRQ
jgi:hypothetical protein